MLWDIIQANKRKAIVLFIFMALCLLGFGFAIGYLIEPSLESGTLGVFIAGILWTILAITSLVAGDSILLKVSQAREVQHDIHPTLFNVVEEMKIASNLPVMPKIYIMDDPAMNAFATGLSPKKSSVAVTAGLLARLNRDELQGVMAHEMSHILNRDVMYMTLAGIMLGTIQLLARVFWRGIFRVGGSSRRVRSSRGSGGGAGQLQLILLILALVLAVIGPVLAEIFYFTLSRRREYLADACGVRLTRYPEGLAGALEKISKETSYVDTANAVTAPMYFAHPFGEKASHLLALTSTHPPITKRIQILRAMSQGVSFLSYQKAYETVMQKGSVLPKSALQDTGRIEIRNPAETSEPPKDAKEKARETIDLMRALNQYTFLICACGLKVKIPPDFQASSIACPRCKKEIALPHAEILTAGQAVQGLIDHKQTVREKIKDISGPMTYQRKTKGWESFACLCEASLQISPSFLGNHMTCHQCGRQIQIVSAN